MAVIRTIGKRKFFRRAVLNGHFRMTLRRLFYPPIARCNSGSKADVDSSYNIAFGSIASSCAIATRCCCPPES